VSVLFLIKILVVHLLGVGAGMARAILQWPEGPFILQQKGYRTSEHGAIVLTNWTLNYRY